MATPYLPSAVPTATEAIPAESGTYALLLACEKTVDVEVGRIGNLKTRPGVYVYVGSAHGPGGLRARLGHHCRISPSPRWHIDYLRACTMPIAAWTTCDPVRREHQWALLIAKARGAHLPLAGFGASDCRCRTHLFFFPHMPSLNTFMQRIRRYLRGHGPISDIALTDDTGTSLWTCSNG